MRRFPAFARLAALLVGVLAAGPAPAQGTGSQGGSVLQPVPAMPSAIASQAMVLGATRAAQRLVSVGESGIVLLSDDEGRSWRQAAAVPVTSTLTAVSFATAQQGWAVGHWGAILHSSDAGQSWQIQRLVTTEDRPLFAVHFFDAQRGVAVGLWSLVLTTDDGGQNWTPRQLPAPPGSKKADLNLWHLFAGPQGRLFAAAERGMVLQSDDFGRSWRYLSTGYAGSLWSGTVLDDGTLLVGGQRGSLYRSSDQGRSWQRIALDTKSSITALAHDRSRVMAVGLDGLRALSTDGALSFELLPRPDRRPLTAVLRSSGGTWLTGSRAGWLADDIGR